MSHPQAEQWADEQRELVRQSLVRDEESRAIAYLNSNRKKLSEMNLEELLKHEEAFKKIRMEHLTEVDIYDHSKHSRILSDCKNLRIEEKKKNNPWYLDIVDEKKEEPPKGPVYRRSYPDSQNYGY